MKARAGSENAPVRDENRICEARWLGRVGYDDASRLQEAAVRSLAAGEEAETFLLLEHPHVVTLGRGADASHVLLDEATRARAGIGIHETGRGGDVTYHGPGQLVGYPILDLAPDRRDVHRYVRDLEEVLIRTVADFGIESSRLAGRTGIWVEGRKLAAIGVRVSRWITSHGFALNVATDLSYFGHIVPCGIADAGVTSILEITGREFDVEIVARSAVRHVGGVFGREITGFGAGQAHRPEAPFVSGAPGLAAGAPSQQANSSPERGAA